MTNSTVTSPPDNLAALFTHRVRTSPHKEAFRYLKDRRWNSATRQQTSRHVEAVSAGLLALGIRPQEPAAIMSETRYEWVVADLAATCAGAATATVYPSTHAEDAAFIIADSGTRIAFVENGRQTAKLSARRAEIPQVDAVVLFEGDGDGEWTLSLQDLIDRGTGYLRQHPDRLREIAAQIAPDQLATLIYTSGTTGRPKGVRLAHWTWVSQAEFVQSQGLLGESDLHLLWLPLAHSFGKLLLACQLACGFVSAIDASADMIVENMPTLKPTFMAAVPRIFEKAHTRIYDAQRSRGSWRAVLFHLAFDVADQVERRGRSGRGVPLRLRLAHRGFDRMVFAQVRAVFGGRMRFFVSGSAALNTTIARWFHHTGLPILEGYGLTETGGSGFINLPRQQKPGTVGLPFDAMSVRISEDGEVQVHGPQVMLGYHNQPNSTDAALTTDGWLRTGDRGTLDEHGFLTITGRINEMFKTSNGKYIAPQAIEGRFLAHCPSASHFLVFGEGRSYCVELIGLDPDSLKQWAAQRNLHYNAYADLITREEVRTMVGAHVDALNTGLNRLETIKRWELLDHELSVESGELTPSLKVRRTVVADRHSALLAALYD